MKRLLRINLSFSRVPYESGVYEGYYNILVENTKEVMELRTIEDLGIVGLF